MRSPSDKPPLSARPEFASEELNGLPGSPGLVSGRAVVMSKQSIRVPRRLVSRSEGVEELCLYDKAVASASAEMTDVSRSAEARGSEAEISILDAYLQMLKDSTLRDHVQRRIEEEHKCVNWAVDDAVKSMARKLSSASDAYLRERSHDIEFIGELIQRSLLGQSADELVGDGESKVIVARDLSPAQTASFDRERVLALVTEVGTQTSHTAILARALGIPAVVGVKGVLDRISNHELLIVDGNLGNVVLSPSRDAVSAVGERAARRRAISSTLKRDRDLPAATRCGQALEILANIELPSEAPGALRDGAGGIGLYRTEFLFVDRREPPSEEEQYEVYKSVLEAVGSRPVTLRTFDIGGDKFLSFVPNGNELNPALGLRAVRLALAEPEVFLAQLRAMIRASAFGDVRVMVPMISTVAEFEQVRALFEQALKEVEVAGMMRGAHVPLGCMIEVPAAAMIAEHLAERAEFFSVGTNDLIQYSLAVDRTNYEVAQLANPFDPAILRLLELVAVAAKKRSLPVSVCGAMASDPFAALLIVGLGVRTLSMEAGAIAQVKAALSRVTLEEAENAVRTALSLPRAEAVEELLHQRFGDRLAELVQFD